MYMYNKVKQWNDLQNEFSRKTTEYKPNLTISTFFGDVNLIRWYMFGFDPISEKLWFKV